MRSANSRRCRRNGCASPIAAFSRLECGPTSSIFDPATVHDRATFDNPNQLSEGMEYVLVNGVPVIDQGKMTGALPGKVLRGAGLCAVKLFRGQRFQVSLLRARERLDLWFSQRAGNRIARCLR